MTEKRKKEESYIVIDASGKKQFKLKVFMRALQQRLMGIAIDNGRMAINTDRQFVQFERSTKDKFYHVIDDSIKYLDANGVIPHEEDPEDPEDDRSHSVDH